MKSISIKSSVRGPIRGLFSRLGSYLWPALAAAAGLQLLCSCSGCSLGVYTVPTPREISILSYNVQNLFDDVHDGSEYYDYDPYGDEWNSELFHLKLLQLSDVLNRYPQGGADILLLQEVENINALQTLVSYYLKGCGYHYSAVSGGNESAVNTAVLSRYPIETLRAHSVSLDGSIAGRPILECSISVGDHLLRLFNCHWKSKSGGAAETEAMRRAAAAVLSGRVREIVRQHPESALIIAGDLNECIDEWQSIEGSYLTALLPADQYTDLVPEERRRSIGVTGDPGAAQLGAEHVILVSPWLDASRINSDQLAGSYAFRGEWETIDHFLLCPSLYDGRGFEFEAFRVISNKALLNNEGYPLRWISDLGTGYSDHLPILLRCRLEP